jgi:hypothetical protein
MAKAAKDRDGAARSATVRTLVAVGLAVTVVSLVADFFVEQHGEFGFDSWTGFHAAFGFVSGLAIIGVAKALAAVLKQPASYYDKRR